MSKTKVYALSGINYTAGVQTGYIIAKEGDALLVDASADLKDIAEVLQTARAILRAVLVTHSHFDHTVNAHRIKEAYPQAPFYASPHTDAMLADGTWTAGIAHYPTPTWRTDVPVEDTVYRIGSFEVRAIATPGHTVDSVCYLVDDAYLVGGDTVMNDIMCGNSMLPTGNAADLYASGQKLWRIAPDSAVILGGHVWRADEDGWELYGARSTVARAKTRNLINRL